MWAGPGTRVMPVEHAWLWPRWCACVRPCVPRWVWRGRAPGGAGASPAPVSPDTDDCADAPCCQQACTNSPGGYECSCYAGYRLSADGCGCEGEPAGGGGRGRPRRAQGAARPACALPLSVGCPHGCPARPAHCPACGHWPLSRSGGCTPGCSRPGLPRAGCPPSLRPWGERGTAAAGASPSSMATGPLGRAGH